MEQEKTACDKFLLGYTFAITITIEVDAQGKAFGKQGAENIVRFVHKC